MREILNDDLPAYANDRDLLGRLVGEGVLPPAKVQKWKKTVCPDDRPYLFAQKGKNEACCYPLVPRFRTCPPNYAILIKP